MPEQNKRVFVSFDTDNDKELRDFIIDQFRLPDFQYQVIAHSEKQAAPIKMWERKTRRAIKRSELVMVVLGPDTYRAPGVLKEVRMAREQAVRIFQVIVHPKGQYKPVPRAGRIYRWDADNPGELLVRLSEQRP